MNDKIFAEMADQMQPSEELQRRLAERLEAEGAAVTPPDDERGPASPPKRRRPVRVRWLAVAAAAVLATALVVTTTVVQRPPTVESAPAAGLAPAATPVASASPTSAPASAYADLYRQISRLRDQEMRVWVVDGQGRVVGEGTITEYALPVPAPPGAAGSSADTVLQAGPRQPATPTNIQVTGVDEGDIVKTDGQRLYIGSGSTIAIVDATGATTRQLATIDLATVLRAQQVGQPLNSSLTVTQVDELMLSGSTLIALVTEYTSRSTDFTGDSQWVAFDAVWTKAVAYDVSDPAHPKYLFTRGQSGGYLSSRLHDGILYLLSSYELRNPEKIQAGDPTTFVPRVGGDEPGQPLAPDRVHTFPGADALQYTVVTALDVASGGQVGTQAILGRADTIYQSTENLYLASTTYQELSKTQLKAAGLSGMNLDSVTALTKIQLDGGKLTLTAQAKIPGQVLNQFALDEYEGHLRIAVTASGSRANGDWISQAALYVLDPTLAIVGALPHLAKNEEVKSVRFDGPVGYVVTFERTDPLFALNLSNPAKPKVSSALKIPGFSSYLHLWSEGQLFGLGLAGDDEGQTDGLKLSMFDISDPFGVTEEKSKNVSFDYSEALENHKAVLVDQGRNLIGFPVISWKTGAQRYLIFSYDAKKGFTTRATLNANAVVPATSDTSTPMRGVIIGDVIYLCSANGVQAYALDSYTQLTKLSLSNG